MNHAEYVRKETILSMAINGVLSAGFFLLVFGRASPVPLWGVGNWTFDFLPQSFMIALMSTLVPGAITRKRLRDGVLKPSGIRPRLPSSLIARALVLGVGAAAVGTASVAAVAAVLGGEEMVWGAAFALKVVYGIALAAIVTPPGLRTALAG